MAPLVYIGLKTGESFGIESTGLGDRILRWQAIITYAYVVGRDLIIPIIKSHSAKPHEKICLNWLESAFYIPKFVTFVDYDKNIHNINNSNAVYLEESVMFEAVTDFFGSIPKHMKVNICRQNYEAALLSKHVRFIPTKVNKNSDSQTNNYIVVHIRQGDEKFNASFQLKKVLKLLYKISYPVVVISDDTKYRLVVEKIITNIGIKIINTEYSNNFFENVLIDYTLMYKCKGIISVARKFSAFPYSICSQTKTPLLYICRDNYKYGDNFFNKDESHTNEKVLIYSLKHVCKTETEFFECLVSSKIKTN